MDPLNAWTILLQHPIIATNPTTVCKLISLSKAFASEVLSKCSGQVFLKLGWEDTNSTALLDWFSKHGVLAGHLQWQLSPNLVDQSALMPRLTAVLQEAAAAARGGLQLASFEANVSSCEWLQHLPTGTLTRLCLHKISYYSSGGIDEAVAAQAVLTRLRELTYSPDFGQQGSSTVAGLVSAMAQLSSLTSVMFTGIDSSIMQSLQHLPLQLLHLGLTLQWRQAVDVLQLEHLAALTCLRSSCVSSALHMRDHDIARDWDSHCAAKLIIADGATLPPNLKILWTDVCTSASPLLPLAQLVELNVAHNAMSAEELRQMASSCTSLQHVRLGYEANTPECLSHIGSNQDNIVNTTASGWASLPLKELVVWTSHGGQREVVWSTFGGPQPIPPWGLTQETFKHLGHCTALTSLTFRRVLTRELNSDHASPFSAALRQLTALQRLELTDAYIWGNNLLVGDAYSGPQAVIETIAGLPQLRSFILQEQPYLPGNILLGLTAAIRLTQLILVNCNLDDCTISNIASSIHGLRDLVLDGNEGITDAVLPIIAEQLLPQLTFVSFDGTRVCGSAGLSLRMKLMIE